jgi:putative redox protein
MEMIVDFPGGVKVDAHFNDFTVKTDQPAGDGGEDSAPSPFDFFLVSLGTCAGYYVLRYCQQHNLPSQGIRLIERSYWDQSIGMLGKIELEIQVPSTFPEKYLPSLVRSAELCTVKKHIEKAPKFEVFTKTV